MGVAERRARGKEALRESILTASIELIAAEGFENLSIRKIAEKIEYAPSTIYLYFQDKWEIVATICEETFDRLTGELIRLSSEYHDPVASLRRGLRCYVDFGLSHPNEYLVLFGQKMPELPPDRPNKCVEAGLRAFAVLQSGVWKCVAAGRIHALDVNLLSQSIWVAIHGLTSLLITGKDPHFPWVDQESLIENSLNIVLRGVLVYPQELSLPAH
jgi:AcrR family transcriptional regulator